MPCTGVGPAGPCVDECAVTGFCGTPCEEISRRLALPASLQVGSPNNHSAARACSNITDPEECHRSTSMNAATGARSLCKYDFLSQECLATTNLLQPAGVADEFCCGSCTGCGNGSYLYGGACLESCPPGTRLATGSTSSNESVIINTTTPVAVMVTGAAELTLMCEPCPQNCGRCDAAGRCEMCISKTFKTQNILH